MDTYRLQRAKIVAKDMCNILKDKGYETYYADNVEEASKICLSLINDNDTVGVGGSETLNAMNLIEQLRNGPYHFLDRYQKLPFNEIEDIYRQALTADVFVSSVNAITRDGRIVNVDSSGNRVAAISFGPKKVILAIGANKDNEVVPTNNANILSGLKFLYDVNVKKKAHLYQSNEYAYIMGGGNVAIDCARSLIRIRDKVALIYRRDKDDMPANEDEIRSALDEGIEFYLLTDIKEVSEEDGLLQINCCHYYKDGKNEDGRSIIKELANSSFTLKGDLLVTAVGQKRNLDSFNIEVLLNHETNDKHVFVVGDAYYGPKNVAAAIKDGRELASRLIGGRDGI